MRALCITLLTLLGLALATSQKKDDYDFGFDAGSHFRREEKGADGKTRGEYGFRTPDGCMHVVSFEADTDGGYRVLGSSKRDCVYKITRLPVFRTITTTRQPTTTTRRPPKTTRRTTTTPTTTPFFSIIPVTSPRPRDPLFVPEVPVVVDNTIVASNVEAEDSQGRQLRKPNLTTQQPSTTTITAKPEKKPEPLYSFGFTTPTHGHTETGLPDGTKKGEYYWDTPEGWRYIVTYEAGVRGFLPKIRRVRISTTTPAPPPPDTNDKNDSDKTGKDLDDPDLGIPVGGCPYYFYYNTRINYHWEHCYMNNTKVGEFGSLGTDGYAHKNAYYADATGFHPTLTRTPLNAKQTEVMAEYTAGVFIVPKPDEERRETEKRILAWLAENRDRLQNPLR